MIGEIIVMRSSRTFVELIRECKLFVRAILGGQTDGPCDICVYISLNGLTTTPVS